MEFAIIEPDGDAELWPANEELTGVRPPSRSGTFCAVGRPFAVRGALGEERPDSYPSLAEGDGRLVVFRDGACWPPRLASVLSGGATTCIVVERNNENVSALAQRVVARVEQLGQSVAQLVWVSAGSDCDRELARASQLAQKLGAPPVLVVVPPGAKARCLRAEGAGVRGEEEVLRQQGRPGVRRAVSPAMRRSG